MEAQLTADLPQTNLNTADLQSLKRFQQGNKQGVIVIGPLFQISLKVDFCPCVKVDFPLLISFSKNNTFLVLLYESFAQGFL